MKFKLKLAAIATAMASLAGSAHADLTPASSGNSSLALVAFNIVTNAYYVRDLGFKLNSFLPNSVTTTATDGGGSAVTGDKTPAGGLTLNGGNTASFADNGFTAWLGSQTQADIRWTVAAGDTSAAAGTANQQRALVAASTTPAGVTNSAVRFAAPAVTNLANQNNPQGVSTTGATVESNFLTNNGFGDTTLNLLNAAVGLYYYVTTQGTLANSTTANATRYGNANGFATLMLGSNGVLTYDLAGSAVPLPAAVWLMGAGLLGVASRIRRRSAAAV